LSAPLKTLQLALLDTKITPLQAIHSHRAFLTNIAVELDKLYPITRRNKWGRRDHATIAEVFTEAQYNDPEPRPPFRNLYATLKDFFAPEEWNVFVDLNDTVNPSLHSILCPSKMGNAKS
jgi:hypothetical protein